MSLLVAAVFATLVWLLKGVVAHRWWLQLACFAVTVYLVVELNNNHALLRIRSRMVSTVFIMLSCMASPLFPHLESAIIMMGMAAFMLILFHSYQNREAAGRVFYAFLLYGCCTCVFVQLFYLLPVLWLLMATQLQAQNGKLLTASLLGITTPYWLGLPILIFTHNFTQVAEHFMSITYFMPIGEAYGTLTVNSVIVMAFTTVLLGLSIIHFWQYSFEDKIRIRLLFGFLTVMALLSVVCLLVQPQFFSRLMPMVIMFSSPLIAHYFTFTESKLTNIVFLVVAALAVLITIFNLWMPSLNF